MSPVRTLVRSPPPTLYSLGWANLLLSLILITNLSNMSSSDVHDRRKLSAVMSETKRCSTSGSASDWTREIQLCSSLGVFFFHLCNIYSCLVDVQWQEFGRRQLSGKKMAGKVRFQFEGVCVRSNVNQNQQMRDKRPYFGGGNAFCKCLFMSVSGFIFR